MSDVSNRSQVWHVAVDDIQVGPITKDELIKMTEEGKVNPDTLVWKKGMPEWIPAREVDDFMNVWDSPPPLPGKSQDTASTDDVVIRLVWAGVNTGMMNPLFSISLDGELIGEPYLNQSYTQNISTEVGEHTLELATKGSKAFSLFAKPPKEFKISCNKPGQYEVKIQYSSLRTQFTDAPCRFVGKEIPSDSVQQSAPSVTQENTSASSLPVYTGTNKVQPLSISPKGNNFTNTFDAKTIKALAVLFVVAFLFFGFIFSLDDNGSQSDSSTATSQGNSETGVSKGSSSASSNTRSNPVAPVPASQKTFVSIVDEYAKQYQNADNDIRRQSARSERRKVFGQYVDSPAAENWSGTISNISISDDNANVEIVLTGTEITIANYVDAFFVSMTPENVTIRSDMPLYEEIKELKKGDNIVFSFRFEPGLPLTDDGLYQTRITETNSMIKPIFLVEFWDINKYMPSISKPSSSTAQKDSKVTSGQPQLSNEQEQFKGMIENYSRKYASEGSEIRKTQLRQERQNNLTIYRHNSVVRNWVGRIDYISLADGEIQLSLMLHGLRAKVMNYFDMVFLSMDLKDSLIKPGTALFEKVADLKTDDLVVADFRFLVDDMYSSEDGIFQMQISEEESMREPEFLVEFLDVQKWTPEMNVKLSQLNHSASIESDTAPDTQVSAPITEPMNLDSWLQPDEDIYGIVNVQTVLNVREEPSSESMIIGTLDAGARVLIVGVTASNEWLCISIPEVGNKWVARQYIDILGNHDNLTVLVTSKDEYIAAYHSDKVRALKSDKLCEAIKSGNLEEVKRLVLNGKSADISCEYFDIVSEEIYEQTALSLAINANHIHIVEYLIQQGADFNKSIPLPKGDLSTPLHDACIMSDVEDAMPLVKVLVNAGANVNAKDISGATPIDYARHKNQSITNYLSSIANDPNIDIKNENNWTKNFKGFIGDKLAIHMRLAREGTILSGSYFYDKYGVNIPLSGKISIKGDVYFEEYEDSEVIGYFEGKIINMNKIQGIWSKPNGSRTMPFEVEEEI